jgi:signal peptidase II
MSATNLIPGKSNRRIFSLALAVLILDQLTKWIVVKTIPANPYQENVVIPGFFNLTHRGNTGAAWSMFTNNNALLAFVALIALVVLFLARRHFSADKFSGQIAFGLIFGGIIGNLIDRLNPHRRAVVDFLHFYLQRRGSYQPWDFPAFNVADSAICTGVALIFILTWKNEHAPKTTGPADAK